MTSRLLEQVIARLPEAMRADLKKTGVLAGLLGVLGIAGLRAAFKMSGPAPARAVATSAGDTGTEAVASTAGATRVSPAVAAMLAARDRWLATPPGDLSRNLFQIKLEHYRAVPDTSDTASISQELTLWDRLAKSRAVQADQLKRREAVVENAQRLAANLKLRSTVMGAEPQAMIDDTVVKAGQTVGAFRVLKIEARRVIVEHEGVRLEIRMEQ